MEKDVRESLGIIQQVLVLLNENLEEIDKRVTMLEVDDRGHKLDDFTIIKIPKNASNLDVLRRVFGCNVLGVYEFSGITSIDLDMSTSFNTRWLKAKYKGGESIETD